MACYTAQSHEVSARWKNVETPAEHWAGGSIEAQLKAELGGVQSPGAAGASPLLTVVQLTLGIVQGCWSGLRHSFELDIASTSLPPAIKATTATARTDNHIVTRLANNNDDSNSENSPHPAHTKQ